MTLLVTVVTPLRDGTQKDDCTRHLVKGKGWVLTLLQSVIPLRGGTQQGGALRYNGC